MSDLKFLGLGFMKTGLTSLHDAMAAMGFETRHRRFKIWKAFRTGDLDTVMAHYETADVFVDWPHPYMYKPFLEAYGDRARFVLTVRDSAEWYESLLRHNRHAHPVTHSQRYIFGRYYPHGFREEHIAVYEAHNAEVEAFFEREGRRDQLLVLRTGEPDSLERLKAFAETDSDLADYPRSNRSARRTDRDIADAMRRGYNRIVQPLYARVAPVLRPQPGARLEPAPLRRRSIGGGR
ncbi:hypothetical protein DDZ18_03885 [Marinicauda salina]|jgi:hypothetical protein|uniref:Sulfotransferase family protein n=1 Tax=Marinicauda salina TaxID=2135793 RepID=A0A2U2BXJ3_9PROT|nr:sulfotransferase [Marinicauda salina]PWE18743.1 hypothetical protein DDZ18_03885 [Marinicauda salina]